MVRLSHIYLPMMDFETVRLSGGGGVGGCIKCLERGWIGKKGWETKILKMLGMLGKGWVR